MSTVAPFPSPQKSARCDPDPSLDFRRLKHLVSIGQVLSTYGLDAGLRQRNDSLTGPCPLHGGDNPTAFRVHLPRGLWHCFTRCGGGDVVELVRRIFDCTHAEAAHRLRRLALVDGHDHALFLRGQAAAASPVSFRPFRRRILLEPRVPFLQQCKGISVSTATDFEAGTAPLSTFLRGTVAVRLHDLAGRAVGYCGRRLDKAAIARFGKWRFPAGLPKSELLFNAHRLRPASAPCIVVVESPWSVMRLSQAGVSFSVALLGTHLSCIQMDWLCRATSLVLLLDGDSAGRRGSERLLSLLGGLTRVMVHELPTGAGPEDLSDEDLSFVVQRRLLLS